jgi:hypothetical protein
MEMVLIKVRKRVMFDVPSSVVHLLLFHRSCPTFMEGTSSLMISGASTSGIGTRNYYCFRVIQHNLLKDHASTLCELQKHLMPFRNPVKHV